MAWLAEVVDAAASGGEHVVAIDGQPGIGKSALALTVLARAVERFPGGVLYEDLGGAETPAAGRSLDAVLARWLRAVGVPPELIPSEPHGLQGLWRTESRAKPMAVLVENVADWKLVRTLRPSAGLLVVTSRRRMVGLAALDDAELLSVGPLDEAASTDLITKIIARRTPACPAAEAETRRAEAVQGLAERCGGVPLAARIITGQVLASSGRSTELTITELDERLSAIRVGETMTEHMNAAVEALSEPARQGYRLLGLHPGPHPWGTGAAAELLDVGHDAARAVIAELVEHHLLEEPSDGRYRFHDLLGEHARNLAAELPEPVRRQAIARMASWYVLWAGAAEFTRTPQRRLLGWRANAARELTAAFTDSAHALAWLDAEQANLSTIQSLAREWDLQDLAYEAGEVFWGWVQARRAHPQWEDICQASIAAAQEMGDQAREARMTLLYALGLRDAGHRDAAAAATEDSMSLATQAGDQLGRASAYEHRAHLLRESGRYDEALTACQEAMRIYERFGGLDRAMGLIQRLMGDNYTANGRRTLALKAHDRALQHFDRLGDTYQVGRTKIAVAEARRALGRYGDAVVAAQQAVDVLRPHGVMITLGHAYVAMGEALADKGEIGRARDSLFEAKNAYGRTALRDDHPVLRRVQALAARIDRTAS